MREREPDPYAVLRISRTATRSEVARAYRALAKQLHPDVSAGDSEAMRRVNWAWHVLSDPVRRAGWDAAHLGVRPGHWNPEPRVRPARAPRPVESWTSWADYGGDSRADGTPISAGLSLGCISMVLVVVLLMVFVLLAGLASSGGRDPGSLASPPGVTSAP
jgi:curved DNA-binding protein CbpA